MKNIVLASKSPRRRELLALIVSNFTFTESNFDESLVPGNLSAPEHVVYSASKKAAEVENICSDSIIIGADTVVVLEGVIMGKPNDPEDAARMLRMLSGRKHEVYTGLCVSSGTENMQRVVCTNVKFVSLSEPVIRRYVETGEPLDKAGGYGIQGKGCALVESIEGCYFNVVGLPVQALASMLAVCGVDTYLYRAEESI